VVPHIHIFGITIQTFGIFFALNFLAWGALTHRRLGELGKPTEWAFEMVVVAVVGGLIGARAYYLIQNHKAISLGNVFSGSMLIWAHRRKFLGWQLFDIAAYGLALGYAIGRIGCQVAGDGDYGKAWSGPWAMGYEKGTVPTAPGETVHPTPIYETLAMGLVAWLLWRWRDRFRPGVLFAFYLVFAGIERFLVEFLRRNEHVLGGLTAAQLESLGLLVIGAMALVFAQRSGGLRRPATAAANSSV
jgi:phosphatidylglycerol:prolipoprotein diacylglycerol transferase